MWEWREKLGSNRSRLDLYLYHLVQLKLGDNTEKIAEDEEKLKTPEKNGEKDIHVQERKAYS